METRTMNMHCVPSSTAFVSATPLLSTSCQARAANTTKLLQNRHVAVFPTNGRPMLRSTRLHMNLGSNGDATAATPVTVTSAPPQQQPPPALYQGAVTAGVRKASLPWHKTLVLAIAAGAYIGLGGLLSLRVGGAMPGLAETNPGLQRLLLGLIGLPTGLTFVLTTGAELFTGNSMLLTTAWLSGRVKAARVLQNWGWSYVGNLLGSLLVVKLVLLSGVLAPGGTAVATATAKTMLSFKAAFWRGVVCNWLVCLAVYLCNGASDLVSKFVAVLLPISAFVAMGMEHSVANMFLIPMGMKLGADVSVRQFLVGNLLPVTLGNVVGGTVFVALLYHWVFGKKE